MNFMTDRNKGIVFILMAGIFFSMMSVFIRLSGDLPIMEKALFRNAIAAVIAWTIILKKKESLRFGKRNIPAMFMRCACGTIGLICNFYAVSNLNISDANLLNKLSPFFAIIMSIFVLKEKAKKWEWGIVFLAFGGAVLVIKPGFSINSFPAFIGLLGGLGAGVAYAFLRQMGKNGVKGSVIVMCFSTFSTLVILPGVFMDFKPFTALQFVCLLGIGLAAAGGQLSITAAYTYAPAKEISVFDYVQVIFAAIWGFLFFGQIPDWISILGYVVIFTAAIIRFRMNKK